MISPSISDLKALTEDAYGPLPAIATVEILAGSLRALLAEREEMLEALKAVVQVADRDTPEFRRARFIIHQSEEPNPEDAKPAEDEYPKFITPDEATVEWARGVFQREDVWRVCQVIKGGCQQCPTTEVVGAEACMRGCYLRATECINTVETGNPWRKTTEVKYPWIVKGAPYNPEDARG